MDYLAPDELTIKGQNFALISIVSPESAQKNDICGVKIKGVFDRQEEAQEYAKKLHKIDSVYDIYLVELYKWLPIPPNKDDIESQEYQDERLNKIVKTHVENNVKAKELFDERKHELMETESSESASASASATQVYEDCVNKVD